jgi:hypothetical protein
MSNIIRKQRLVQLSLLSLLVAGFASLPLQFSAGDWQLGVKSAQAREADSGGGKDDPAGDDRGGRHGGRGGGKDDPANHQ